MPAQASEKVPIPPTEEILKPWEASGKVAAHSFYLFSGLPHPPPHPRTGKDLLKIQQLDYKT